MKKRDDVVAKLAGTRRKGELAAARSNATKRARVTAEGKLVRTWIEKALLAHEPTAQATAWVQYRYMTPLERTELFTRVYRATYIEMIATHFPDDDPAKKQPIDADFAGNEFAVMKCLWAARQHADMHGVPYDLYLRTAMEGKVVNGKWTRPPMPNQLIDKLTGARMRDLLDREELVTRLYGADWDSRFKAAAYRGDPVQEAALQLVVPLIRDADNPAQMLAEYLCERQAIAWERAEELFGDALVAEAMELSVNAAISGPSDSRAFAPACVGFPDASSDSPCAACPVVVHCVELANGVRDALIASTGSDDPRKAWKRQLAKMRKRKQRKKEKEELEEQGDDFLRN